MTDHLLRTAWCVLLVVALLQIAIRLRRRNPQKVKAISLDSLKTEEITALLYIFRRGECYGLEIVQASGGTVSRWNVYLFLERLEAIGMVSSRLEDVSQANQGGLRRRMYSLTPAARMLIGVEKGEEQVTDPWGRPIRTPRDSMDS